MDETRGGVPFGNEIHAQRKRWLAWSDISKKSINIKLFFGTKESLRNLTSTSRRIAIQACRQGSLGVLMDNY